MGLYEVPLSVSLLGFGIGTMLANFHECGIIFLLRAVLNILVRNASPRGPMYFRCLIFSPVLFNMVINRLLQLDLGSKVQMTAYADDLAIHGGPIGEDIVYKQITTALKKIEAEAMQLGLKFSPEKCEALWYRSVDPD